MAMLGDVASTVLWIARIGTQTVAPVTNRLVRSAPDRSPTDPTSRSVLLDTPRTRGEFTGVVASGAKLADERTAKRGDALVWAASIDDGPGPSRDIPEALAALEQTDGQLPAPV